MIDLKKTIQVINQEIDNASSSQVQQILEINNYLYSYVIIDDEDTAVIEYLKFSSDKKGTIK